MCRAIKVMCVAPDLESLGELRRASVGAEWELAPGATSQAEALAQLDEARAHVLVVSGDFPGLEVAARERYPGLRIVIVAGEKVPGVGPDAGAQESDVVRASLDQVRSAIIGLPRPGGPVRAG